MSSKAFLVDVFIYHILKGERKMRFLAICLYPMRFNLFTIRTFGFPVMREIGNVEILVLLKFKIRWKEKSFTLIIIQSIMANVNMLWNW